LIFPGIYILSIRIGSSILQTCWVIHPSKEFGFNIKNWSIFTGDLPILKFKIWPIFTGDLPFSNSKKELQKTYMFPWNWSPFTGNLPILKIKSWFIFTGDLSFSNSKNNFSKCPCFLEIGLFSQATYSFWNSKTDLFWQVTCLFKFPKELQQASMLP
jgi:hypothetical protein